MAAKKNILVIGAGRSSASLISYLLEHAGNENWEVVVGDVSEETAAKKVKNHPAGRAIRFDITNAQERSGNIQTADIVISMLPASMHLDIAKDCLRLGKHLVTASYVSREMKELDKEVKAKGLIFLNEIGLDPGIDHMSAMQIITAIKASGGKISSFKSWCGGLVAPGSNDNPWGYKFSWNPRNVVLAGQGSALYIENGHYKLIPYNRIFTQTETITIEGTGRFDGYANRDSLSYREPYGLGDIPTLLRGTLRHQGYCKAWNSFVKLGWTDDTIRLQGSDKLSYQDLLEASLPPGTGNLKERLATFLGEEKNSEVMQKLEWLELFTTPPKGIPDATPAQLLQALLEEKWKLNPSDKDMIVMQHQFEYSLAGKTHHHDSTLVVIGDDQEHTAMAKTVGLPAAIAAKLILRGNIKTPGVIIPTLPEIYVPVQAELNGLGIRFKDTAY